MNAKMMCVLVLGLTILLFGCGSSTDDEPTSITFGVRNSYNGCSVFGDNWCMSVTCPGYD